VPVDEVDAHADVQRFVAEEILDPDSGWLAATAPGDELISEFPPPVVPAMVSRSATLATRAWNSAP